MSDMIGKAVKDWKPSTAGGLTRDLQNAWAMTQGQPIPSTEQDQAAYNLLAQLKSTFAGMGEEFQNIPNAVLGQWIKEYLGGEVEAPWQAAGTYGKTDYPPQPREKGPPKWLWQPTPEKWEEMQKPKQAGF